MAAKVALITGATGQDGYYLSELLQRNGIEVHDVPRALLSEPSALAELITSRKADYILTTTKAPRPADAVAACRRPGRSRSCPYKESSACRCFQ